MLRTLPRFFVLLLLFLPGVFLSAEKVADLPVPTTYVNDFAHVLTPAGSQEIESLCRQVHSLADAELVVVTIKSLDDGQSIEEFTAALEEKWKLGKKGQDRSALVVLSLNPRRLRVETGYGLEGILNDAKVGQILDPAVPLVRSDEYDQGMLTIVQGLATVIAADKGVTLGPLQHTYHRQAVPPRKIGLAQILLGIGLVLLIIILASTGNLGWAIYLLLDVLGSGGGGRGGDDDDRGGGFGGVGGGASGGGGASRDF